MKKTGLILLMMVGGMLSLRAQFGHTIYGADNNYTHPSDDCTPFNTGILTYGDNINHTVNIATDQYLTFTSPGTVVSNPCPSWFGFMHSDASGCYFIKRDGGVDMITLPQNSRMVLTAKASVSGAKLKVYIGSASSASDFPSSSTWYTGSGTIDYEIILTTEEATYTMDFDALNDTNWDNWSGATSVNVFGIAPVTEDVEYKIGMIGIVPVIPMRVNSVFSAAKTNVNSNTCGTSANIPLSVTSSSDHSVIVTTGVNGHVLIDPSFRIDNVMVSDMHGRTEVFSSNEFYTMLNGILILNCISGDKVKKVKIVME